MRILWVCNKAPSKVGELSDIVKNPMGGWLDTTCENILEKPNIQLCVLFLNQCSYEGEKGNFSFYSFTRKDYATRIADVMERFKPDLIHIWGTEYVHSLATVNAAEKNGYLNKCIISIQGLVSLYGKHHYTEGLPDNVVKMYTFRDLVRHNNILQAKRTFIENGNREIEAIQKVRYVIGRTDWDRAATEMFNPHARYFFCNETLRNSFYENRWNIGEIQRHRIFVSQCGYPIKGFHYILQAMPEILKHFPDAHIYTTGPDLFNLSWKQKIKISSYQVYLRRLISELGLQKFVTFLGVLSEQEMCSQYLLANVFVSASTIENSPNSVGEAMLVGCPVVTSDVGGVKNMITHEREGYIYQSTAPYMLAYYVKQLFRNDELAVQFSNNAREHALMTHNREKNMKTLLDIYKEVGVNNRSHLVAPVYLSELVAA